MLSFLLSRFSSSFDLLSLVQTTKRHTKVLVTAIFKQNSSYM